MTSTFDKAESTDSATPSKWILVATIPIAIGVLLQRFGQIVYLTRLDRILDPLTMAGRGFDLWNPYADMGAVQWQQNGYWIPFDFWFSFTRFLHIPVWLGERFYIYGLLLIAVWGFTRLADAMKIGRPLSRLLAAITYALSPVILARVGWQSPFAMGTVLAPWVMLPLARGAHKGSTRAAAARSCIPIALMGGVNAAVTFAVLPVPLLYLLTRQRGSRRAGLLRWWLLFAPLSMLWWGVGLAFFGKYGPDFLQYTESIKTTTSPTTIFEVLRGTADWIARLPGPANPASFSLALKSIPIAGTSLVAAVGLAGLARRNLRERSFIVACLALGVAAIGGGYMGIFGNPAANIYSSLLETVFTAFRNIYKFQPLVTLPLAFGIAHFFSFLPLGISGNRAKLRNCTLAFAVIATVVAASWPLWSNTLTRGPGFKIVPAAWDQAGDWLSQNSKGRVLVVPGIPDADFEWGFTAQIPLEWGTTATWATRSQAPSSGLSVIHYLDTVELAIERGGDTGLADYLRRGGFSNIVVPNDQLSERYVAPSPESIRNALTASGLERVIGFGERDFGYGNLQQVEIYSVPGAYPATTYPINAATWITGDIGSILTVPQSNFGNRVYLFSQNARHSSIQPDQWIITDGNLATTTDYGPNRNNRSYVHSNQDDDPPPGELAVDRTHLDLDQISAVTASSVGPGMFIKNVPTAQPMNAIDGDASTWWEPLRVQINGPDAFGVVDPTLEINYKSPQEVNKVSLSLFIGPFAISRPIQIKVTTDSGEANSTVLPIESLQDVRVVPGPTSSIRIAIARSSFTALDDVIGIREVNAPKVPVAPRLDVPTQLTERFASPTSPDPAWIFTRLKNALSPRVSLTSERQIARKFNVPKDASQNVLVSATATHGQGLLNWLGTTPALSITADSTWGNNPNVSARNLIDGSLTTPWRSGTDITATGGSSLISMKWNTPRTLSSLKLVPSETDAMPKDVVVYAGNEARGAPVALDGTVEFAPLTTSSISLRINYAPVPDSNKTASKQMGFTSIEIPAIADLYPGPIDRAAPYTATCGSGPTVTVGTTTISYSVSTTTGALIDGTPFDLLPCGTDTINLTAGTTLLDASSGTSLTTIDRIVIGNSPTMAPPSGTPRAFAINHWGTNDRTVNVDSGSEGLFVVNETFNEGWEATLNGTKLAPIMIDGWRQGFVLPDGEGGAVHLRFAPDRIFKIGTIFGLFTLLAVFVMALWPDRKKRQLDALNEGQPAKALLVTGVIIGAVWCTGIGSILLLPAWWIRNHRRDWLAPIAFLSMGAAGVLVVIGKRIVDYPSHLWGAASYPVSALAATAFLCALVTLLPRRPERTESEAEETHATNRP
jgi:arabinofuranan 3-O-arabinosyltransferase